MGPPELLNLLIIFKSVFFQTHLSLTSRILDYVICDFGNRYFMCTELNSNLSKTTLESLMWLPLINMENASCNLEIEWESKITTSSLWLVFSKDVY